MRRLSLASALSLASLVGCTVGSEQVGDDDVTPTPGELSGTITTDRALSGTVTLTADATIAAEDGAAWREHTSAAFAMRSLPGDHFFLQTQREALLRLMSAELSRYLAP